MCVCACVWSTFAEVIGKLKVANFVFWDTGVGAFVCYALTLTFISNDCLHIYHYYTVQNCMFVMPAWRIRARYGQDDNPTAKYSRREGIHASASSRQQRDVMVATGHCETSLVDIKSTQQHQDILNLHRKFVTTTTTQSIPATLTTCSWPLLHQIVEYISFN